MSDELSPIQNFFKSTLAQHGPSAQGVGWNSVEAHEIRFEQLLKVVEEPEGFSLLDYGCGYGAIIDTLNRRGLRFARYAGYDIVPEMLDEARRRYAADCRVTFTGVLDGLEAVDYTVSSGVFNIKLDASYDAWTEYVLQSLNKINALSRRGFSVNFLTTYSDPEIMATRPDLYYADPCYLFDYCKRHFSRQVALLHDYKIYDFTLLVRKPA